MGLTSQLNDVGSDSLPILLVATAATWVSYLRSLLLFLLHPFTHRPTTTTTDCDDHHHMGLGSGLAGLILLAEHLNSSSRAFSYGEAEEGPARRRAAESPECVVCLCGLRSGDSVRRLSCCCHVFHKECLDGWFDQMKLSCPLCRSPLVSVERQADVERRIGADLVAWLSPYRSSP